MIWGGNQYFKGNIITILKEIFNFGPEEMEASTYIGIRLKQNSGFSIKIDLNSYIDSIQEIVLSEERRPKNTTLTTTEKTLYRSIVGQLNWVAGISQLDISFAVCESSTKFTYATVADIINVSKIIIRKVKSSRCFNQFPKLDSNNVKLQLFTDAGFNNLPNGGSQARQITSLTDSKNRTCPLHWNSSKMSSTIAADALSPSDGCDVAIYIIRLVSEILRVFICLYYISILYVYNINKLSEFIRCST